MSPHSFVSNSVDTLKHIDSFTLLWLAARWGGAGTHQLTSEPPFRNNKQHWGFKFPSWLDERKSTFLSLLRKWGLSIVDSSTAAPPHAALEMASFIWATTSWGLSFMFHCSCTTFFFFCIDPKSLQFRKNICVLNVGKGQDSGGLTPIGFQTNYLAQL